MKKKILSCFVALFAILTTSLAQGTFQPRDPGFQEDNKGLVYEKEFAVDFRVHTNGYALALNFGTLKTYYLTRYMHFELGEIKHPKEYRNTFDLNFSPGQDSRSFIFGKQNNLFVLRGGIGEKRYFSEKAKRRGLAVGISYEAGPALGLLKPYYLDLSFTNDPSSPADDVVSVEKYSPENADDFLNTDRINGATGFTRGLGEIRIRPGIQAKAAVHFDWGAFDEFVKGFEAGIMADVFFTKIPIMVEVDNIENRPFFINLYLNLQLGKRR